jgi:hypothetical protein
MSLALPASWLSGATAAFLTPRHDLAVFLLISAGTGSLVMLVLHFVFGQPWARLLMSREYDEADEARRS